MRGANLHGILVPHVTPFTRQGELDEEALRTCVRFWLEGGVSGLVPCGSNGEAPYLSREERQKVIETVVDEADGKVPVVAGTGSLSTRETIMFTKDAKDLGVDAALVVTPFYYKLSGREVYEHYSVLLEAVDLPIVLYSVPKFTGFSLEPSIVSRLAGQYENVVGIKDSSGSIGTIAEIIRLVNGSVSVLAGAADVTLPALMLGARGSIIAVANVFPEISRLYEAFKKDNYEEAIKLQQHASYLNEILVKRHNQLSAIKEALRIRGLPSGYPRRPVLPLKSEEKKGIKNLLKDVPQHFSEN